MSAGFFVLNPDYALTIFAREISEKRERLFGCLAVRKGVPAAIPDHKHCKEAVYGRERSKHQTTDRGLEGRSFFACLACFAGSKSSCVIPVQDSRDRPKIRDRGPVFGARPAERPSAFAMAMFHCGGQQMPAVVVGSDRNDVNLVATLHRDLRCFTRDARSRSTAVPARSRSPRLRSPRLWRQPPKRIPCPSTRRR